MKIIVSLILILGSLILKAQTREANASSPIITFIEKAHDFGDITEGEKVSYIFKFKNTGTAPLLISDVVSKCGCTSPQYSKVPVMPGGCGEITIIFNSAGKQGIYNKTVGIQSNAVPVNLFIRVNVLRRAKFKL